MAKFFIDRPVFAWVLALIIVLGGILSIMQLPIAQYPNIAPPTISVTATYPGASAKTLEDSVTSVIEQELNGAPNLLYYNSTSESTGLATITIAFAPGSNVDLNSVEVQNRLKRVEARLPAEVRQQGVRVDKAGNNYMMFLTVSSKSGTASAIQLGNYVSAQVIDSIRRVPGVGQADLFGTEYAMRIWLDPSKLTGYNLTPLDVTAAVSEQNVQVAVGELGGTPSPKGTELNATVTTESRLSTPEQFGNILLRTNPDGSSVRIKDVGRVELGGADYSTLARTNGKPSAAIAIKLAPTGNALATATAVRAKMEELSKTFPADYQYTVPYDTSAFVKISIEEVIKTLLEAVVLVFLVMYLFLQNFRATIIPTLVVPIALLGTFGALLAFGFSINVLTMFGMVLAIGILVDDAIVVVENVERIMSEEGLSPREATRKAMGQITGAIVGITLVLTAVFIPMAFFSGSVGNIYRQFSLSLIASMAFSALLALTLTPALCATLLKPVEAGHHHEKKGFFGWFNRTFATASTGYQGVVARILKRTGRYLIIYALIIAGVVVLFKRLPSSFLPDEDQGYMITVVQLPNGATQDRTIGVLKQIEDYYLQKESKVVDQMITVAGFSFFGRGQNGGIAFVRLKDWKERTGDGENAQALVGRAFGALSFIKDAIIFPLNPPAIAELGNSSGFDFRLQDRTGQGHAKLMEARNMMLGMAAQNPVLMGVRPEGQEDAPQLQIDIDREKARALGVSVAEINSTLSIAFGSSYVNDFIYEGRVRKVIVQADGADRRLPDDLTKLRVKNSNGDMVAFAAFATSRWIMGSPRLERYNGMPAVKIAGQAAPGRSTGEAMRAMEENFAKLPPGFGFEWSGQSYEERLAGSQEPILYTLSLIIVFLCLAALYESWSIPFSVLLVVPLGVLGALLGVTLRGMPNDVYFKVGLIATIGLSAKNAILIVEFAKDLQAQGKGLVEATLEAVHLRFRPILMTSMAFILGVLPLAIATGAGSGSQRAIGTGVMGGMITATVLAIFLVPVFFVVVRKRFKGSQRQRMLDKKWHDPQEEI
ncbi:MULTISPECIES: efflux RND transporter permease subunit [Cupriavidus]|uniref:Efflux pump membrane transporter n=1 Tax=Cupriavidus oxalaticus TaxID=96344 RepID=A0A4V1BZB8_9BURK|nr:MULTISPECIES: efflux RND transporter permease subunit [Cupriavidus]MBF6987678.1 efflux RND transporter permease subunit [Cupriavidus sp. IK-TO18]QBY54772.1 efflux RND transporter permease subunit [Cupriavidus oxalaticus]TDF63271.1 efflux RND transporter permease subunit [Cupriavidus sp. L7L]